MFRANVDVDMACQAAPSPVSALVSRKRMSQRVDEPCAHPENGRYTQKQAENVVVFGI